MTEILWKEILTNMGEDFKRPGLLDTPKRVTKMYNELFYGYDNDQAPKITTFKNGEDGLTYNQMIIDSGTFNSFCEHHILPFFGVYTFAYIPESDGNIVGLSKIARVISYHSAKLQVQERLGQEIVDTIWEALASEGINPKGIALVLKAEHMCKRIRGVKTAGEMITITLRGIFKEDGKTRDEFMRFVK